MMAVRYYLAGDSGRIIARVTSEQHLYEYWDRKSKAWVPSAYVADCVTGYKGGRAMDISESEALALIGRNDPQD